MQAFEIVICYKYFLCIDLISHGVRVPAVSALCCLLVCVRVDGTAVAWNQHGVGGGGA